MNVADWERLVRPHFDFLIEYGFEIDPRLASSEWYATEVVYRSERSAVIVTRSVEFDRVELELARLRGSKLPPTMVFVSAGKRIDQNLFDNVLEARAPERLRAASRATGLRKHQVERQLRMWASLLRDTAPDFLAGSMAALDEAEEIVRRRVRAEPQEVTVWLPADASDAEEEEALREARRDSPQGVQVVVRRYSR